MPESTTVVNPPLKDLLKTNKIFENKQNFDSKCAILINIELAPLRSVSYICCSKQPLVRQFYSKHLKLENVVTVLSYWEKIDKQVCSYKTNK